MISIIAKFFVKEGEESNFFVLINPLIEASLAEDGCIEYALQKHTQKARTFCLIEKWKDTKAVDLHNNTAHFTSTIPQLITLAKIEIDVYDAI